MQTSWPCFILILDSSATFSQGQDHFRDPGSDGVPLRAAHHTQRPEARKHLGRQGFSHQGTEAYQTFIVVLVQWAQLKSPLSDCRPRTGHLSNVEQAHQGGIPQKEPEGKINRRQRSRHTELHGSRAPRKHPYRLHGEVRCLQLCHCGLGYSHRGRAIRK